MVCRVKTNRGATRLRKISRLLIGLSAALSAAATVAPAQSILGGGDDAMPASVKLHAGWAEPDGRRIAGLRMDLEPGWKTYWRAPGGSGIPPHFDWTGSENLASVNIVWPSPRVFHSFGARSIGYAEHMTLPLELTAKDASEPIRLRLALFYGLCEEVCIPAREDLTLDIDPGARKQGAFFIEDALAAAPKSGADVGLASAVCELSGAGGRRAFTARLDFAAPIPSAPIVVAEGPAGASFDELETRIEDGDIIASGDLTTQEGVWVDRSDIRLTIIGGAFSVEIDGCVGPT